MPDDNTNTDPPRVATNAGGNRGGFWGNPLVRLLVYGAGVIAVLAILFFVVRWIFFRGPKCELADSVQTTEYGDDTLYASFTPKGSLLNVAMVFETDEEEQQKVCFTYNPTNAHMQDGAIAWDRIGDAGFAIPQIRAGALDTFSVIIPNGEWVPLPLKPSGILEVEQIDDQPVSTIKLNVAGNTWQHCGLTRISRGLVIEGIFECWHHTETGNVYTPHMVRPSMCGRSTGGNMVFTMQPHFTAFNQPVKMMLGCPGKTKYVAPELPACTQTETKK